MENTNEIANSITSLPYDILFYIFLKLPISTLLTSKSVCKSWHNIIIDPSFTYKQRKIGNKEFFLLVGSCTCISNSKYKENQVSSFELCQLRQHRKTGLWTKSNNILTKSLVSRGSIDIVGSCNGLICLKSDEGFYIMNPFYSEDFHKIPLPDTDVPSKYYQYCGFCFDDSIQKFKIVFFARGRDAGMYGACVYDFQSTGISSEWRKISPIMTTVYSSQYKRSVFAKGSIHWMMTDQILSLNLKTESFENTDIPSDLKRPSSLFFNRIFNLEGNLGIAGHRASGEDILFWVLEKNNCSGGELESNIWVKKFQFFSVESQIRCWPYGSKRWHPVSITFLKPQYIMLRTHGFGPGSNLRAIPCCFYGNMKTGLTSMHSCFSSKDDLVCHEPSLIPISKNYS